jgi:hypothetical protein
MTPAKTQILRKTWKKAGDLPCEHLVLVLQSTENGYVTGQYVCTRCGKEVFQKERS